MRVPQYSMLLNEERLPYLTKEHSYEIESRDVSTPEKVVTLANEIFNANKLPFEKAWVFATNSRNKLIACFQVSQGSLDSTALSTREIIIQLLLCNAASFILLHNHPSGECSPSTEDINFSRTLRDAGKLMNIHMMDSIIIGDDFASLMERGLL